MFRYLLFRIVTTNFPPLFYIAAAQRELLKNALVCPLCTLISPKVTWTWFFLVSLYNDKVPWTWFVLVSLNND